MPSAPDVAAYFVAMAEKDGDGEDNDLTNLKLQKLCAYAQAFSLAALGRPIFDEEIEAWPQGPVIPSVYERFSRYGRDVIQPQGVTVAEARARFDDQTKFILELVHGRFSCLAAHALSGMARADFPGPFTPEKKVIRKDAVRRAFMEHPSIVSIM